MCGGEEFCDSFKSYSFSAVNFSYPIAFSLNLFFSNNKTLHGDVDMLIILRKVNLDEDEDNYIFSEPNLDIMFSLGFIVRHLISKFEIPFHYISSPYKI